MSTTVETAREAARKAFEDNGLNVDENGSVTRGEPTEINLPPRKGQLSFEIGGEAVGKHLYGTITIGGKLETDRDLNLEDELRVQVMNAQGEVVAGGPAIVGAPAFIEQRDKEGEIIAIERAHKAKVER